MFSKSLIVTASGLLLLATLVVSAVLIPPNWKPNQKTQLRIGGTLIELNENNWQHMFKGEWMIFFSAPDCQGCKNLAVVWKRFAHMSPGAGVHVATINALRSPWLVGRFYVTHVPKIFHVKDGEFRIYRGPLYEDPLIKYVKKEMWKDIKPISAWLYPDTILMSIVGFVAKMSFIIDKYHWWLNNDLGLNIWVCYAVVIIGMVCFTRTLAFLFVRLMHFVNGPSLESLREKRIQEGVDENMEDLATEKIADDDNDDKEQNTETEEQNTETEEQDTETEEHDTETEELNTDTEDQDTETEEHNTDGGDQNTGTEEQNTDTEEQNTDTEKQDTDAEEQNTEKTEEPYIWAEEHYSWAEEHFNKTPNQEEETLQSEDKEENLLQSDDQEEMEYFNKTLQSEDKEKNLLQSDDQEEMEYFNETLQSEDKEENLLQNEDQEKMVYFDDDQKEMVYFDDDQKEMVYFDDDQKEFENGDGDGEEVEELLEYDDLAGTSSSWEDMPTTEPEEEVKPVRYFKYQKPKKMLKARSKTA